MGEGHSTLDFKIKSFRDLTFPEIELLAKMDSILPEDVRFHLDWFRSSEEVFCAFVKERPVGFVCAKRMGGGLGVGLIHSLPSKGVLKLTGKTVGTHLMGALLKYCKEQKTRYVPSPSVSEVGIKFADRFKARERSLSRHPRSKVK